MTVAIDDYFKMDIDYNWHSVANCKGIETSRFFPSRGEVVDRELKQACEECPVKSQCLNHALKHETYGYWGGTTEKQRVALRRELKIAVDRPEAQYFSEVRAAKTKREEQRVKIKGRGRKPKPKVVPE